MLKKSFIILGAVFGTYFSVNAQQDAHLTHYSFNNMYFNPAYAGVERAPNAKLTYRNHWLGYQNDFDPNGAGNTTVLTADMPLLPIDGGLGLSIVNDVQPSVRNTSVNLALSKHVVIGKGKLNIGIQGSFANMVTGLTNWRPPDGVESIPLDNAILKQGKNSYMLGDMSTGLWYQSDYKNIKKGFYVGASMSRLLEADFENTQIGDGGSKRHLYVTGGYNIEATYDLILTPTLLYKTDFGKTESLGKTRMSHSIDVGAKAEYQETYWGGLNFRQGEAFSLLIGASFMDRKQLKIGYAIDLVAFGTQAKALTSHELMAAYYLPKMVKMPKPIIRTPRYKF